MFIEAEKPKLFYITKSITRILYLFQAIFQKKDRLCPYCSKSNFDIIFKKNDIVDICYCKNCNLYWTNPIFQFPKFYNRLYKAEGLTTQIITGQQLKNTLQSSFKGTDKYYIPVLKWLRQTTNGNKLLEFGSSWGYFLYQAKLECFESVGVEISQQRRDFGREHLNVDIYSDIDEIVLNNSKFDIIFTAHTLEHLGNNIKGIFDKFYNLLNNNGILFIEVPYFNLKRGKEIFSLMGAIHPLGFIGEFFLFSLTKIGFNVSVHYGYKDFIPNFRDSIDNLVIIARK